MNLTATNGRDHLHEIREPIRAIDPYADLTTAASEFGLEDGFDQLSRFFTHVTCYCCEGVLVVTEVQPLVACILSSDRPALVSENPEKLARLIEHRMKAEGAVHITQDTAMFEAVKEERKQRD